MQIVRAPFRVSFFGGSTDYKDFYENYGSLLIGTTIDKYAYLTMRYRPSILEKENNISYSQLEITKSIGDIKNSLIRETLKYYNLDCCIDFKCFSDIPFRTGLGGSSTFCVALAYLINKINGKTLDKRTVANDAIHIERNILKDSGGIQDQIWASYGGFNSIEISETGKFSVKPLPVSQDFKDEFEKSIVMIYTNQQRNQDEIAKSHENVDKKSILQLAIEAYNYFEQENIKEIGNLMYESWKEKARISSLISTKNIDSIVNEIMSMGAYGVKLLGGGGCGFLCAIVDPITKVKLREKYNGAILDIKFENEGVKEIYTSI